MLVHDIIEELKRQGDVIDANIVYEEPKYEPATTALPPIFITEGTLFINRFVGRTIKDLFIDEMEYTEEQIEEMASSATVEKASYDGDASVGTSDWVECEDGFDTVIENNYLYQSF